jgi:hypothetical protein
MRDDPKERESVRPLSPSARLELDSVFCVGCGENFDATNARDYAEHVGHMEKPGSPRGWSRSSIDAAADLLGRILFSVFLAWLVPALDGARWWVVFVLGLLCAFTAGAAAIHFIRLRRQDTRFQRRA